MVGKSPSSFVEPLGYVTYSQEPAIDACHVPMLSASNLVW